MDSDERIFEIELERLKDFPQHPFKVLEDRQMIELMESIRKYGVLNEEKICSDYDSGNDDRCYGSNGSGRRPGNGWWSADERAADTRRQ